MFWGHIARTVLHCSVREAKHRITHREFLFWAALYRERPWGDDWHQAAIVASILINIHRKRGKPPVKPEDLIPTQKPRQTPEEMAKILEGLVNRGHVRRQPVRQPDDAN